MKMLARVAIFVAAFAAEAGALKLGFIFSNTNADVPDDPLVHKILEGPKEAPGGGINPFPAHGKQVEWPDESKLPKVVQYILVGVWVFMLASIPVIIPILDHTPVTKTQQVVGLTMLVALLGSFYLFTKIILFQSVHLERIRPLTVVECVYFMSTVTTVGYRDVTPANVHGQVFVGLYVLGASVVIGMLVSDMITHVATTADEYKKNLSASARSPRKRQREGDSEAQVQALCNLIKLERPSAVPLLTSIAVFAALDICWILFFFRCPGEGKAVHQATHMSAITLSTVAFGHFTPATEAGMMFGAFWRFFGAGALANVMGNFAKLMVKMKEYERSEAYGKTDAMQLLNEQEGTELHPRQSLSQTRLVSEEDLVNIGEAFKNLAPKKRQVRFEDVQEILEITD